MFFQQLALCLMLVNSTCYASTASAEKKIEEKDSDLATDLDKSYARNIISILNFQPIVPRFIYHCGDSRYMNENILNNTVSEFAWSNSVFKSRMKNYRQGLYGTAEIRHLGRISRITQIKIELTDECRHPSRISTVNQIRRDSRFQRWVESQAGKLFTTVNDFYRQCFASEEEIALRLQDRPDLQRKIARFNATGLYPSAIPDEKPLCNDILDQYFKETRIALVLDDAYEGFQDAFYIRDRDCIKSITNADESL
jgi:hypothetical protein